MRKQSCSTFALFDERIGLDMQMHCVCVDEGPHGLVRANTAPL